MTSGNSSGNQEGGVKLAMQTDGGYRVPGTRCIFRSVLGEGCDGDVPPGRTAFMA